MNFKKITVFLCLSLSSLGFAAPQNFDFSLDQNQPENLVINNRILLKINGKPISVMDVVRKMDLLFYKQYPELASSSMARYQFYTSAWRSLLGSVIDDQLIMADAEEKGVVVNDGEVREELEITFGPDVVLNLDRLGMTLSEALDLLKTELTVSRMMSMMVRSKSMTEVHPQTIRERFDTFMQKNPPQDYWVYQILSIRGEEHQRVAAEVHRLISEENIPFQEVVSTVQEEGVEIAYSEEYEQRDCDMSVAYRAVLQTLSAGVASAPVSNKAGSRLFCLKEYREKEATPFKEKETELKQDLLQEALARNNEAYRAKLREYYGITDSYLAEMLPQDLQPFALN